MFSAASAVMQVLSRSVMVTRVEPKGEAIKEAIKMKVNLHLNPHLWAQALESDRKIRSWKHEAGMNFLSELAGLALETEWKA